MKLLEKKMMRQVTRLPLSGSVLRIFQMGITTVWLLKFIVFKEEVLTK